MSTYKYIHLTNGDHIFAEIQFSKEKTGFFKLKRPLKLSMKEDDNHVHFGFMPWIPFSDDEEVPLQAKSVITMANLNDEYKEMYIKGLEHHTKLEEVIEFDDPEIPNVLINKMKKYDNWWVLDKEVVFEKMLQNKFPVDT